MPRGGWGFFFLTIQQVCDHYLVTKSYKITAKMFGLSEITIRYIVNKIGAYAEKI